MQLAATHASTTIRPSADPTQPPVAPAIRNVFLTSALATSDPSVVQLSTLMTTFELVNRHEYGGHRVNTTMVDGSAAGISMHAFLALPAERKAAQAVLDAIVASGLLQADLPPLDWKNPAAGRTRLYLDRRAHFLEFETGKPPAVVQPVLDALAAYEQIARRNREFTHAG